MLLFTRVTMGKAKIAATVWNGIITFATSLTFCLIPWMLYGDASYWILHKHEQLLHAPALEHILRLLSDSVSEGIHSDTLF
ncbi:MAG: hypothetical protein ACLT3Y_03555 [Ruminococcus callidus]